MRIKPDKTGDDDPARYTDPNFLILLSLARGDKHGYGIIKDIATFCGTYLPGDAAFGTHLASGIIYPALRRLEDQGLILRLPKRGHVQPYRLSYFGKRAVYAQAYTIAGINKAIHDAHILTPGYLS